MAVSVLETFALRKDYPGTTALKDVTVRFEGGGIHALVGKNGAGKSTLVKIFAGSIRPTSGTFRLNGEDLVLASPRDALDKGIAAVHQELSLVPEMSVAENVLLGRLPRSHGRGMLIDWPATHRKVEEVLKGLGLDIDVRVKAGRLGVAQQQAIEIAKAMSYEPAVLMLDEPTSALALRETDRLFELLRQLAARGVIILYISHRLQELGRIADDITVMRNGEVAGRIATREASPDVLARLMFGGTLQLERPPDLGCGEEIILEVKALSRGLLLADASFSLHRGEILGIAGLLGSGRTELLRAMFGADRPDSGTVTIGGTTVVPHDPGQMRQLGMAFTPENRKEEGLIQGASTRANLSLASLARVAKHGFLTRAREQRAARKLITDLDIKVPDIEAAVSCLSGGNQQKVVAGKWLAMEPKLFLFDEPTRGIDVQAKQQMFQIMWALGRSGIGIVMVSSELEELVAVCHRILIMRHGRIAGDIPAAGLTVERLFALCMQE